MWMHSLSMCVLAGWNLPLFMWGIQTLSTLVINKCPRAHVFHPASFPGWENDQNIFFFQLKRPLIHSDMLQQCPQQSMADTWASLIKRQCLFTVNSQGDAIVTDENTKLWAEVTQTVIWIPALPNTHSTPFQEPECRLVQEGNQGIITGIKDTERSSRQIAVVDKVPRALLRKSKEFKNDCPFDLQECFVWRKWGDLCCSCSTISGQIKRKGSHKNVTLKTQKRSFERRTENRKLRERAHE